MRKRELARALEDLRAQAARMTAELREETRETAVREEILSSMDEAVVLAEGDLVVYANPAATDAFGAKPGDALPALLPRPSADGMQIVEVTLHHPRRRELRCSTMTVGEGRLLVVAKDVGEAKRIDRIRRDFVADASHELKTPIAGILATAETLPGAIEDDPATAQRFASTLAAEARRLSKLVGDLLSLARLEQQEADGARVDLPTVLERVLGELRAEADEHGVSVSAEMPSTTTVIGSDEDLGVMIRNLLENAIRYTPAGGDVRVRLEPAEAIVRLVVSDTGIGIPSRDLPRVFERFYRVDRARSRETGGTGLGLSIVRHVAESHGGSVEARSELGRGSTFTVELPLAGD